MSCPICGKQSLSNFTPYCRNHVNIMWKLDINTIEESVLDKYASVEELKYTEDKLTSKLETLNKENLAMTEDMCFDAYELAMKETKQDIKDVYYSLNWFQKLLWRILGLNRL